MGRFEKDDGGVVKLITVGSDALRRIAWIEVGRLKALLQIYFALCLLPLLLAACVDKNQESNTPARAPYVEPTLNPMTSALMKRAEWAMDNGTHATALALCDKIEQQAPGFARVYFLRGQALSHLNQHEAAGIAFAKVAALHPEFPLLRFHQGNNAAQRKRFREALAFYQAEQAALQTHDDLEKKRALLLQIGRVHRELRELESALAALREAVTLDEKFHEAHDELGQIYQEQGELERALAERQRATELQPENGDYAYYLGALLVQLGRQNEALPHLEKARAQRPWFYGVHYNLGRGLLALGRKKEGEQHLAIADSLQNRNSQLGVARTNAEQSRSAEKWRVYADMLAHDGRFEEALAAYQTALVLNPRDSLAAQGVQNIRMSFDDQNR